MEVITNHLWKTGQSGNPLGRPKGSKNKISEKFLENLYENWERQGANALDKAAENEPMQYVKMVASLVPRELMKETSINISFIEALKQINQSEKELLNGSIHEGSYE
jgi:hypothetical protein